MLPTGSSTSIMPGWCRVIRLMTILVGVVCASVSTPLETKGVLHQCKRNLIRKSHRFWYENMVPAFGPKYSGNAQVDHPVQDELPSETRVGNEKRRRCYTVPHPSTRATPTRGRTPVPGSTMPPARPPLVRRGVRQPFFRKHCMIGGSEK